MKWLWISIIKCIQPQGVKVKMRGHKLRSGAYWQGMLRKTVPNKWGTKRGLHVLLDP
jgi:hypothetical protein